MPDQPVLTDVLGTDPGARLAFMADALADPHMVTVLRAAAAAWRAGDRSWLLLSVIALAEDLAADALKGMTHGR